MARDYFEPVRKEEIRKYVSKNDGGCTKTDVINYMNQTAKGDKSLIHASLATTHKILTKMIQDKIIISRPDENNSQTHLLSINNENEYNRRIDEINKVSKIVLAFTKEIDEIKVRRLLDVNHPHGRDFLNYIHWVQSDIFHSIAAISTSIVFFVKSKEDQETLNLLLNGVLRDSYKLNEKILPFVKKVMEEAAAKGTIFEAGSREASLMNSLMSKQSTLRTISNPIY
jgi:hypothetical protein